MCQRSMSSGNQNNYLKIKEKSRGDHKSREKPNVTNTGSHNGFKADCVFSSQESTPKCFLEEKGVLLKLLEKDLEKNSEAEDSNDNLSDDEDGKLCFEETSASDIPMHLPYEISESDLEDHEEKDHLKETWTMTTENENTFDGVYGLNDIKETLFNIVIYPSMYPQFFPKKIRWNQILLYGPPGTGKTMLAKALAPELNATLHRITSADLLSHWQGQTEKQIRDLFEEIQANSEPKILFFDEIDGLFRKRTSIEDESTRRIKTELLICLDDFTAQFVNHQTFLIGATNCPWEIDSSFMRRFHKKIFVPLPNKEARLEIMKKSFDNVETDLTDIQWNEIGERTEGYSGSDLVNVVMTACCERFKQTKKTKYWEARGDSWVPVGSGSLFSTRVDFEDIHPEKVGIRNIIFADLTEAIAMTPKTVGEEEISKYMEYSEQNNLK